MGCVRKRGNSWNAQVRISGQRSFTKTFQTKLDAKQWIVTLEKELKSIPLPEKNIKNLKLKDLFNKYKKDEDYECQSLFMIITLANQLYTTYLSNINLTLNLYEVRMLR